MTCAACGFENPQGMKFCGECGKALRAANACSACGFESPPGFKFCGECGAALGGARPDIPPHLADKIRQSRPTLEGERKQVTVLFADVKGSTALTEQAGPERWAEVLEGYLKLLAEGVHRFEGTVSQYTGDGIMALFGAPIAHEDHAARACLAALWLRDALGEYAAQVKREHGLDLETRIGLNSGEVVVGKIGQDLGMDFTAQGQTVHLAQRMEQLAEASRPCLAPATATLVEGLFALEDRGEFEVKGVSTPLRVRALVGMGEDQTRLDAARSRGLTPFVGRGHELGVLDAALAQARDGRGQIVGVVGEAGVGKSRLCAHFLDRIRADGTPVYAGHCLSHGKTLSHLPMRELIRALLGVAAGDAEHDVRLGIDRTLAGHDDAPAETLALVLEFLGLADPDPSTAGLPLEMRQRQLFHFVRRLVEARSFERPAVLFLDDAHWIDPGSDTFLAHIAETVAELPALLLANFRPEYRADWMARSEYQQLPLRRLGERETEALLDELVGRDGSLAQLRERIRARTGGNPFFVEEVVRSLEESGSLEGARGAYRLTRAIEAFEVPSTVQPVLAGRIDRLAEREKHVLQAAAVIGKEFSQPILAAVLAWPERDLAVALETLKHGEFIFEASSYPVTEYAFKHPLTQEVALGSQLRERRARTHTAVARALAAAHPDRLDDQAALLAHHYEQGGRAMEAARWHRRAADRLFSESTSDMVAFITHWERVYRLARPEPVTPESMRLLIDACTTLVFYSPMFALPLNERDRIAAEGRMLAERLGDSTGLCRLEWGLASGRMMAGWSDEGPLAPARRAVDIANGLDLDLQEEAAAQLGNALMHMGRVPEATTAVEEALALDRKNAGSDVRIMGVRAERNLLWQRGVLLMWRGRPREAEYSFETSLKGAEEAEEAALVWLVGPNWVPLEELTGAGTQALVRCQRALECADETGSPFMIGIARIYLGWAQLRRGNVAEALESLLQADEIQREGRVASVLWNLGQAVLAEAHLAAGDAARARMVAERCTAARDTWVFELRANLARARVLRALDGADARDEIEATLGRAQELVDKSGAQAFAPFILEERARLSAALGDDASARTLLHQARDLFAEVDATGHIERLAKELGL